MLFMGSDSVVSARLGAELEKRGQDNLLKVGL